MPDAHRVVLVPERHVDAVEAYLRDLEALDADGDTDGEGEDHSPRREVLKA